MSDSQGPPREGEPDRNSARPIDVKAMPRVLRRIVWLALKEALLRVLVAVGCSLGSAVASLTLPRLFGHAVDQAAKLLQAGTAHVGEAQRALLITAALVLIASSIRGGLTMVGNYESEWVSQKVAYRMRMSFFQQLQRLPFGFHDKIHSGDLITRGMLDLEGARAFIQNGMMMALTLILLLGAATYMMLSTDLVMGLMGLAFVPIAGWALARM